MSHMLNVTEKQSEHNGKKNSELKETMRLDRQGRIVIHIPFVFKKRGGRKEMILPPGCKFDEQQDATSINKPLAIAVALGHRWLDLLIKGRFHSVQELAETVNMDPSQIRRHLKLACIDPKIVKAILNGNEPDGMSLEGLKGIPLVW